MDVNRQILNTLMGRDRNKPSNKISQREHYSNRDVCKPFLVCFCFNTLFPNTTYDEGPCTKRHDTYLKTMFDNDLNKSEHEKQYISECIKWIDKRLVDVEQKIKKNQALIDNKSSFATDRPKQVVDRLIAIDQDIERMMQQARISGQNGQIDQSSRCLEEVDRLRDRRKQIEFMGDNVNATVRQQKICQICGAIQTINDTQKRIQMHLQGKIHQGFLKLRHQVQTLKVRLEILNSMDADKRQKQRQKQQPQPEKVKHSEPVRHVEAPQPIKTKTESNKERTSRSPSHKKKKKQHKKQKQREKDQQHYRERQHKHRDRERDREEHRDRTRDEKHKKEDRHRGQDRDYDRERNKEHKKEKKHKRDHSRSREKERTYS